MSWRFEKLGFEKFGLVSYISQTKVSKFIEFLAEGKIVGSKCAECGRMEFPPRAYCPNCLSDKWEWVPLACDCTLLTFTRVESAPAAFRAEAPYLLGLAQFSEGPKVLAWIDEGIQIPEIGREKKLAPYKLANGNLSYKLVEST